MSQRGNRLYNLLPAIYRQRDEMAGQPLQALLAVIENEFNLLESDMDAAYDNWFIETSDAWVIPYLADLVGIEDQTIFEQPLFGQRRLVANHVAYQRRKGLSSILAHISRDVSGWYAYVADLSERVAQTQSVKNVKLSRGRTLDLRQGEQAALLGTAFDRAARTADVRRVDADTQSGSLPGMVSKNALALYLWRLQSYPIRQAQAGVPTHCRRGYKSRQFTFDPLGRRVSLFIQPEAIDHLNQPMHPGHFPQPLTRAMLKADLAGTAPTPKRLDFSFEEESTSSRYYGPQREFSIWVNGCFIPAGEILSGQITDDNAAYWNTLMRGLKKEGKKKSVVVDPENGRFLLAKAVARQSVTVNYTYGCSNDLGSGPFLRSGADAADELARQNAIRIDILKSSTDSDPFEPIQTVSSLEKALDRWQELCDASRFERRQLPQAIIRFLDSGTYPLMSPLQPDLPSGSFLSIEAAAGERPTIITKGNPLGKAWSPEKGQDRRLRLQGLLVKGPVSLPKTNGGKLDFQIQGCTFTDPLDLHIPENVSFDFKISASMIDSVAVEIQTVPVGGTSGDDKQDAPHRGLLMIEDSVVGKRISTTNRSEHGYTFETGIQSSTILGDVQLSAVSQIRDSIVMGCLDVTNEFHQGQAVMQYSYAATTNIPDTARAYCFTLSQCRPQFTSTQPVHPGYAQLRLTGPAQIRNGASNGAEMGAFNSLQENRREANLKRMLPDYLPLGQKIGIFKFT
jgi:hypothetical protein